MSPLVMVAEVQMLIYTNDNACFICKSLSKMLGHSINIETYAHDLMLSNIIAEDSRTEQKRMQIDIFELKKL